MKVVGASCWTRENGEGARGGSAVWFPTPARGCGDWTPRLPGCVGLGVMMPGVPMQPCKETGGLFAVC